MQDIICAICGRKQQKKLLYEENFKKSDLTTHTFSARRNPDRIHYRINKCTRCSLIFSSPIFKDDSIAKFYEKSLCSYKPQIKHLTKTYIEIFSDKINNSSKDISVLEIGCGDAFFLKALYKKGYKNLYGVEPSKKMVASIPKSIRRNTKQDIFKRNLFNGKKFDVICCFHTLDHVTTPNEFISETYRLLKKDGIALFIVHDTGAFSARVFGEKSPIFDIEHIYLFNKLTLARIFETNGFKKTEVGNLVNTYPLEYWVRMAGIPSALKKTIFQISSLLRLNKKNISMAGGNIYIAARK